MTSPPLTTYSTPFTFTSHVDSRPSCSSFASFHMDTPPPKRQRRGGTTRSQFERISLQDDYEVLQARTSSLGSRGQIFETPKSPMKGRTAWTVGESWAPEDDTELSLDADDGWFDEEMDADVGEVMDRPIVEEQPRSRKKRSQASVSRQLIHISSQNVPRSFCYRLDRRYFGKITPGLCTSTSCCAGKGKGTLWPILSAQTVYPARRRSPKRQLFGAWTVFYPT